MLCPSRVSGVVILTTMAVVLAFTALSIASHATYEPGQIIAKFAPEVGKVVAERQGEVISVGIASLDGRMGRYGVHRISQIFPHKRSELALIYQLEFDPQYDAKAVARDFAKDKHLLYAEPRYLHHTCDTPNDARYVSGFQWFFATVQAPDAWDVTHGDDSVIIGIVDTGVDWNHPDLSDNIWINPGEDINGDSVITGADWNAADDDSNGYRDDFYGYDFANNDWNPSEASALLGTHAAGVAAAVTNNEVGVAGMSWNCSIMVLKVSSDGSNVITDGYEGIQYATDNGAQVINLSWARIDTASAFEQEIIDSAFAKGIILVAAAGNDEVGNAFAPPDTCPLTYPGAYPHVTAVAATDMADRATDWTFYGSWVDVSAPGASIYSTLWDNDYQFRPSTGIPSTSAACALVSGVAALLKVTEPNMNSDEFEERVRTTCDNIDALNPTYVGWLGGGRLNAYRALMNIVSVEEAWSAPGEVPDDYALSQNHPNPFNAGTTISYSLPVAGHVALKVYNVRGQLVKTLVEGTQPAGKYAAPWNGYDREGQQVASGIYFYRLSGDHCGLTKKMILLR